LRNIHAIIRALNPFELFFRITDKILKSDPNFIRVVKIFINHIMIIWHVVQFARVRVKLRRMSTKKQNFPYEDYPTYM